MLNPAQISELVNRVEFPNYQSAPQIIWVTGPFAVGKSTIVEYLKLALLTYERVEVFLDAVQMFKEVQLDTTRQYHTWRNGDFIVT